MARATKSKLSALLAAVDYSDANEPLGVKPELLPESRPVSNRFQDRLDISAKIFSGDMKDIVLHRVDPARCRMWSLHNRDYARLTPDNCADLISSIRSERGQRIPAIVRKVKDDPAFDYEVVSGARRHFAVSYLRNSEKQDIKYLVIVESFDDEEAWRVSDLENRVRDDLSEYERARDFARALHLFYGGEISAMANRLSVERTWLHRFVDLGKLPVEVVRAFNDLRSIRIAHVRALKPFLDNPNSLSLVLKEADLVAAEQVFRVANGSVTLSPTEVIQRLKVAAGWQMERNKTYEVNDTKGKRLFSVSRDSAGGANFSLPNPKGLSYAECEALLVLELRRLFGIED